LKKLWQPKSHKEIKIGGDRNRNWDKRINIRTKRDIDYDRVEDSEVHKDMERNGKRNRWK
jgi:hypothetical protein